MDSLGDYIYLILILIVAVSSILGKKKKKASEVQSSMPDLPDLDDVLPEYTEYTEYSEQVRPVYQPSSTHNSTIDIPSYETVEDFSVMRAKKQVLHANKHFIGSELTVSEDNNFNIIELDTVEDVKKAFIYAEIFRRKY